MKSCVIIPARGGSKRIPRKNIRNFCGKPMLAWSIEAALACPEVDEVVVSTDDEIIAEVALHHGAKIPFLRPQSLADDYTGTIPVIRHAIEVLAQQGKFPEQVCCLYATAPFVTPEHLSQAYTKQLISLHRFTFSATHYRYSPYRAMIRSGEGVAMLFPEHWNTRSQDLPEVLHDAGMFYWGQREAWLEDEVLFGKEAAPYLLPHYLVQDIDTEDDWIRAELIWQAQRA